METEFKVQMGATPGSSQGVRTPPPADPEFIVQMGFVQRWLPWILAGVVWVVFLITTGGGTSPHTLLQLGRVAGWDWQPVISAPLHFLVTWPLGLLPAGWQLFALNLLAATFGALTVWLLARSVALLPHDRTKDQRQLERSDYSLLSLRAAWLPPTLAVLVCGLQVTFWEHATAATGEMLDLLVFAWLVRCLLEFRLDHRERWLWQFAFVYGLGVTNNYALIGFFPAFLLALVWIKWATFFNWRFVLRMALWGLAGLLLYLLLPTVASVASRGDYPFWELLRTYMGLQKSALGTAFGARVMMVWLCFTSFLPVLFIGIRWPASFGDTSPVGQALTNLTTHVIHLVFFGACLYVTLDLHFSPRLLSNMLTGGRFVLLPFYYLGALAIGYFAGYVLLVFGTKPDPNAKSWQRPSTLRRIVNGMLVTAVWVVLVAMPAALAWRNLPKIRLARGPALNRLSEVAVASLPGAGAAVLADDVIRLHALADELRRHAPGQSHILIESGALQYPAYHRFMERRYGARWPTLPPQFRPGHVVDARTVTNVLATVGRQAGGLFYLHPSFGYFFEGFYLKPTKAVYELKPYPEGVVSAPTLTPSEIQAQHAYWQQLKASDFGAFLAKRPHHPSPGTPRTDSTDPNDLEIYAAGIYSRAINWFGVEVQRAGDFKLAGDYFKLALELNDKNASALINEEYNQNVQAGNRASIPPSDAVRELIRPFGGNSDALLNVNGPPDEPSACFFLAQTFSQGGNFRQAAQALERTLYYNPTNITAHLLYIAQILQIPMPHRAMTLIQELRARPPVPLTLVDELDLMRAEAWALVGLTNLAGAEKLLEDAQRRYPTEPLPFVTEVQIYDAAGLSEKAIGVLERQLKVQPENYAAMVNLPAYLIRTGRPESTIPYLDRVLQIKPKDPTALLNRALGHLLLAQKATNAEEVARHAEAALADYLEVESTLPDNHYVVYGIAECYRLKKNREESISYFKKYQKLLRPGTPERRFIDSTLDRLKSGGW